MIIQKKYHFYAAHRNKEAGGKCSRIHGHTYKIIVNINFLEKDINPTTGVFMLFEDIDKIIEPIFNKYDHYLILDEKDSLCQVLEQANEPFLKVPFATTLENFSKMFFLEIKKYLPISQIEINETLSSQVTYNG